VEINANDDYAFTTPAISVPEILAEPGAICTGNCNTHQLAGGNIASWKDYAYLAIKATARVRSVRNQTTLQWGDRNNFAGLEIEIKDKNGQVVTWNPRGTNLNLNWRCLGGAEQDTVGTSWRGYNLWLRGPQGSNGGNASSAVCPGGVYDHDAIQVPRGGSYRVRAHLANTGNNRARAIINVLSYFDEYINTTAANKLVECTPRAYNGFDQEQSSCSLQACTPTNCKTSYCPSQGLQSLSDSGLIKASLLSCGAQRQSVSFSCSENAQTIPESARTLQTASLAVCSDNWKPLASSTSAIDQETICSWESEGSVSRWQEVGAASCELAKAANNSDTCETPFTTTGTANTANCQKLKNKIDEISQATQDLNSVQILGAPKFQNLAKFSFGQLENIRTANFWTNQDLQGSPLDQSAEKLTQSVSGFRAFVKKDNSSTTPSALDFLDAVKNTGINAYGWEDFEKQASLRIHPTKLAREDYQFSKVYPFNETATEEIYYGQVDAAAGWDFQADCTTDTSCGCKEDDSTCNFKTHDNLEQMLREHAAREVREAGDPDYAITTSATHVGFKDLGKYSPNNLPELPTCYPTRAICSEQKSANDQLVYLGRSNTKPSECSNYQECFSRVPEGVDLDIADAQETIDLDRARQAGMNELKKIVPFAVLQQECGETPACAEIDIDTSSASHAVVQVRYNMPVGFPLSTMLQKDSIQIIHEKSEVIERDFAGSNFYK
jgi:hypothetical protein